MALAIVASFTLGVSLPHAHRCASPAATQRVRMPIAVAAESAVDDPFLMQVNATATLVDEFNRVCYDEIFLWIPRYKEAGFSTFRFEDFLDGRVRKLVPSVRRLVLRAAAPATLGVRWAEAAARLDAEEIAGVGSAAELEEMYDAHAVKARGDGAFADGPLGVLEKGASLVRKSDAAVLEQAFAAVGSGGGGLAALTATVEQTVALACSMVGLAALDESRSKQLDAERVEVLTGSAPDAPIGPELIAKLRLHRDFAAEALGAVGAGGADELSTSLAIAIFVQLNRMFELNLSKGAEQPQGAAPRTLAESAEVLAAPRMYYEIQRGVKKLRF